MDLLRHLAFFTTVAQTRHFGHAAQDLGMTQPPLSQGIQRLERQLGVRLFDRGARGVRLTDEGQRLLPMARELVQRGEEFVRLARTATAPARVRLGMAGDLEGLTAPLVASLSARGVEVAPEVSGSVRLVDRLLDGELDLAVVRHPGVTDGLTGGEVVLVPTRLERPPSASDRPAGPAGLAGVDLPVATPPRHHQPPAHDQLVDDLRRAGHSGEVVESPDTAQRAALVAAGAAVRLVADPGSTESLPPLRLRVVWPRGRSRRTDVDHEHVAELVERALR